MAAGSFKAQLVPIPPLSVDQFVSLPDTPGNVGVCLSGGGSRALSAGMGQLRALSYLQLNGKSLLSQTKALSTVSGGSWLGVTFEYLTAGTSDDDYLNQYVPDPGKLVPTRTGGATTPEILDELPPGNIGNSIDHDLFSVPALAIEAFILYKFFKTPPNFLWQALMGLHILGPYGLDNLDAHQGMQPTSLFSWDPQTLAAEVTGPNPSLGGETAHLIASTTDPSRTRRPFLVCNTAMFLNEPKTKVRFLAPVQATGFSTGIVGAPKGTDANGRAPGGGGVTSFAFNSNPTGVDGAAVTVSQTRQLALADIVGASSAAFAETLQDQLAEWQQDPHSFFEVLDELADDVIDWLVKRLPDAGTIELDLARDFTKLATDIASFGLVSEVKSDLANLQDLIPEYQYWPVAGAQAWPATQPTRFADAGSLENLGVASLLAFTDIDNVISFINSSTPLGTDSKGVIIVDSALPPLFGYQPYQSSAGYVLYPDPSINPQPPVSFPLWAHSQIFPSEKFQELLDALWQASGSGTNAHPAQVKQTLEVLPNAWFGVRGGKTVGVLWVYTNRVVAWYDLLSPSVQAILGDPSDPTSYNSFPHYGTIDTDLTATEINLLANLTAWSVAGDANQALYLGMYSGS